MARRVLPDRWVRLEDRVRRRFLERPKRAVSHRVADAVLGRLPIVGGVGEVVASALAEVGLENARALLPAPVLVLPTGLGVVVDVRVLPRLLVVVVVKDAHPAVSPWT